MQRHCARSWCQALLEPPVETNTLLQSLPSQAVGNVPSSLHPSPHRSTLLGCIQFWFPEQCASPAPCLVMAMGALLGLRSLSSGQHYLPLPNVLFSLPWGWPPAFPYSREGFQVLHMFAAHWGGLLPSTAQSEIFLPSQQREPWSALKLVMLKALPAAPREQEGVGAVGDPLLSMHPSPFTTAGRGGHGWALQLCLLPRLAQSPPQAHKSSLVSDGQGLMDSCIN